MKEEQRKFLIDWVRPFIAPLVVGLIGSYLTAQATINVLAEKFVSLEKRVDKIEAKLATNDGILLDVHKSVSELKGMFLSVGRFPR